MINYLIKKSKVYKELKYELFVKDLDCRNVNNNVTILGGINNLLKSKNESLEKDNKENIEFSNITYDKYLDLKVNIKKLEGRNKLLASKYKAAIETIGKLEAAKGTELI